MPCGVAGNLFTFPRVGDGGDLGDGSASRSRRRPTEQRSGLGRGIILRIVGDEVGLRLLIDGERPFQIALPDGDKAARRSAGYVAFPPAFYPNFSTRDPDFRRQKCLS